MTTHILSLMLDALSTADKTVFLANSTASFAKVAEPQFESISKSIAPRLRSGYTLDHLGNLKRQSGDVSLFKISFSNTTDETVAMISEKDGKVAGLLLK